MHARMHERAHALLRTHTRVCRVRACMYACVRPYVRLCVCVHACAYGCVRERERASVFVCVCVFVFLKI